MGKNNLYYLLKDFYLILNENDFFDKDSLNILY
jgi:hypothetical protein